MALIYNITAPKKPTNVTVNSDLLNQAKSLNINISATLETALVEMLKKAKREEWLRENSGTIEKYNEKIAQVGLFSDELRTF